VIDNIVWTDSWLSIAVAGCGLIGVGACEEQARKVYASGPPGVEQTSRLGLRDSVTSGMKCELRQEQQDEVVDNFFVEPQNKG
jgi:hypothetical protein